MIVQVENGYATTTTTNETMHTFQGALYDQNNHLINESQRTTRGDNEWNPDDPVHITRKADAARLHGNSLYLGHYTGHYGHFLLETLGRFWFFLDEDNKNNNYDNFVFHPFLHKTPSPENFSPAKICFECFGIDFKKFRLIERPVCIDNITIPQSCFEINHTVDKRMAEVYSAVKNYGKSLPTSQVGLIDKILGWKNKGDLKLYLSRRKTKGYRPMLNEREVEKIFLKAGFKIFHPERWSFEQQLAIFDRTKVLAGIEGSALHNSVFMQAGTQVLTLGTPRIPSGKILNQDLCNSLSKVNINYIQFKGIVNEKNKAVYDLNHIKQELEDQC